MSNNNIIDLQARIAANELLDDPWELPLDPGEPDYAEILEDVRALVEDPDLLHVEKLSRIWVLLESTL